MRSIFALAIKDIRLLMRDRAGSLFVFLFPLVYAVFFGVIFSGEGGSMSALPICVADEDGSEASKAFVDKLRASTGLSLVENSREEGETLVRQGKKTAYVLIPKGFGQAQDRLFEGSSFELEVGVDPTRKAESGMLQGILTRYAFEGLKDLLMSREAMHGQIEKALVRLDEDPPADPVTKLLLKGFLPQLDRFLLALPRGGQEGSLDEAGREKDEGWQPIRIEMKAVSAQKTGPKTSYDITFPQAIVWVLLGCCASFAVSLVSERTRGTLQRLRSAPITVGQILAGKALACFLTVVASSTALFTVFRTFFGVRPLSYPYLALAVFAASIAFVGIMMLISVLGKTEAAVGGIGWAVLLVMAMTGGGMVPLVAMPSWMQTFSNISFVKWTVLAVEGAVWRGFDFHEMVVPCAVLLAIGTLSFLIGVKLFRVTAG